MARYIKFGEPWRRSELEIPGTVIQRPCQPWGYNGQVSSPTPCCGRRKRITLGTTLYLQNLPDRHGTPVKCPGCGKRYWVRLLDKHSRELLPDRHHSTDVMAEWERIFRG